MKRIVLTQYQYSLVDDEDYEYLMRWKWCALKRKCGGFYAVRTTRKSEWKNNRPSFVYMHAAILERKLGRNSRNGYTPDHKNRNGLDNRRKNIREATHSQQLRNRDKANRTSSKYRGVHLLPSKKWQTKVKDGKGGDIFLGNWLREKDAAIAYDNWAKSELGEFAILNFPGKNLIPKENPFKKRKSSKYRGVTFNKTNGKWQVSICYNKNVVYAGCFEKEIDAAKAYDTKAKELLGNKAKLNFMENE